MKGAISKLWAINLDVELKTFKRKVECLTAAESDNLTILENAEIQPGKKRRSEVVLWFSRVKEKKSVFQQIEIEFREKGPSRNLKNRIEDESREVEELIQQGKFPAGVVLNDHESTRIPMVTTKLVGQSFTENADSILKLLNENAVSAIGVYGMGGVGKTTLVKQIYNSLLTDADTAGQVYWVTVSRDCSLEKLQNEIGKVLCLKLADQDKERKKALIFERLLEIKKSVIILDDLWKHYLLDQVGIPLDSCCCKTVMTTRSSEVCRRMGCQNIIKIEPLLEDDAWKLFGKHSGVIPSYINKLAGEIVEECGGLPLALVTMGCCARAYDTIYDWENALYELRRPVSRQDVMEEEVFRVLKFSFDSLKDQNVQNCFLCCALFPEDRKISRKYLVDLWIDVGLLDEVPILQYKVSRGHAIINRLISSCLLESTYYNDDVRMHDLLRDMATIITQNHPRFMAKSGEQQKKVPEEEQWSKDLVKVSLSHNKIEEIPNGMAPLTPGLTVLLLNYNRLKWIPESFFKHMRALTVLDLSYTVIERLPESVSDLVYLRALLLTFCHQLIYLPSLAKLSELRVLDLSYTLNIEKAPEGIERLKCLEKVTYCRWDISDSTRFNMLIQSSLSLSCYRFVLCDPAWYQLFGNCDFSFGDNEKKLYVGGAEIGDDMTTYLLPATIEKLEIVKSVVNRRNLRDAFPTLGLATELRVLNCKGLKYISSSLGPFFENMYLRDLPDLRGIMEFGGCTFSHLNSLFIKDCPKIKVIFPFSEKQLFLPNLRIFEVSYCDELEEIFQNSGSINSLSSTSLLVVDPMNANNPQPNPIPALPKLRELSLGNLPKLGSIYKDLHLSTSLQQLEVVDCPKIEQIFEAPKSLLALPRLWKLKLQRLPNLSSIHKGLLFCTSLKQFLIQDCFKLKRLPLSKHLICDDSSSSLLPLKSDNPELWEVLWRNYSEDAHLLSDSIRDHDIADYINQVSQPASLSTADDEHEQNDQRKWGACLSL